MGEVSFGGRRGRPRCQAIRPHSRAFQAVCISIGFPELAPGLGHPPHSPTPPHSLQPPHSTPRSTQVTCVSHTAISRLPASPWSLWALHCPLRPGGPWEEPGGLCCPHWTSARRMHSVPPARPPTPPPPQPRLLLNAKCLPSGMMPGVWGHKKLHGAHGV